MADRKIRKWYGDHNFRNDSDHWLSVMLEPGEKVRVYYSARVNDSEDYDGEQFGFEVELAPGARMEVLRYP